MATSTVLLLGWLVCWLLNRVLISWLAAREVVCLYLDIGEGVLGLIDFDVCEAAWFSCAMAASDADLSLPRMKASGFTERYFPLPQPASIPMLPAGSFVRNFSTIGHGLVSVSLEML